jgi:pSer/pThr/pTyr-binding forkhead associated (FHA) protein
MTERDEFDVDTVLAPKVERRPAGAASFALTVVEGADRGKSFLVAPGRALRVLAGQSPACDLRLTDRTVSRRHAAFELSGARLRVTDLQSTNGTLVQGLAVMDAYLQGGEVVRVGETAIRVERESSAGEPPLSTAVRFGRRGRSSAWAEAAGSGACKCAILHGKPAGRSTRSAGRTPRCAGGTPSPS